MINLFWINQFDSEPLKFDYKFENNFWNSYFHLIIQIKIFSHFWFEILLSSWKFGFSQCVWNYFQLQFFHTLEFPLSQHVDITLQCFAKSQDVTVQLCSIWKTKRCVKNIVIITDTIVNGLNEIYIELHNIDDMCLD
jgi:hypothetical protein